MNDQKKITIVVNGSPHEVDKNYDISYQEVVELAFPGGDQNINYSVKYKRGQGNKPEGILSKGAIVKVKDGMIFDVTQTGQS